MRSLRRPSAAGQWSAPAVVNLGVASVGLQAGVQKASIIMMFMRDKAVENLLDGGKISGGAGIDVAAGPVGSDVGVDSQPAVVSYSRSKGLFVGVNLEGAKVSFAKKVNAEHYGEAATARDVLHGDLESADALKSFHHVLTKFADRGYIRSIARRRSVGEHLSDRPRFRRGWEALLKEPEDSA